jgi:hypothetical protein
MVTTIRSMQSNNKEKWDETMAEIQHNKLKRRFYQISHFEDISDFRALYQKSKQPTLSKMRKILIRIKCNICVNNGAFYMKDALNEFLKEFRTTKEFYMFNKIIKEKKHVVTGESEYIAGIAFYFAMTIVCECPTREDIFRLVLLDYKIEQSLIDEYVAFFRGEHFTVDFDALAKILLALNAIIYKDTNAEWLDLAENIASVASNLFVLFDCMKCK